MTLDAWLFDLAARLENARTLVISARRLKQLHTALVSSNFPPEQYPAAEAWILRGDWRYKAGPADGRLELSDFYPTRTQLESTGEDLITRAYHIARIRQAERDGYDRGRADGQADGSVPLTQTSSEVAGSIREYTAMMRESLNVEGLRSERNRLSMEVLYLRRMAMRLENLARIREERFDLVIIDLGNESGDVPLMLRALRDATSEQLTSFNPDFLYGGIYFDDRPWTWCLGMPSVDIPGVLEELMPEQWHVPRGIGFLRQSIGSLPMRTEIKSASKQSETLIRLISAYDNASILNTSRDDAT